MTQSSQPTIYPVKGFSVAGVHCGYKPDGALDFALIYSDTPCVAAGVFTTNQVKAAPVLVDMEKLAANNTHIRAVVINTKCANACTGQQGLDNAHQMARWTAERLGIGEDEVLVMSTGVIGTQLEMDKIRRGIDLAADALDPNAWEAAARAIMTTDTRPKVTSTRVLQEGYAITGIAKGAGMIAPNMATMLGIVVTDAGFAPNFANQLIHTSAAHSFNQITIDGDMSTNDTLLLLANGAHVTPADGTMLEQEFTAADEIDLITGMTDLCETLAKAIVRDGEGATKFIEIMVTGMGSNENARKVADAVATSPLVKTAFYGGDPNWGRIIAAAGRAGIPVDPMQIRLYIAPDDWRILNHGKLGLMLFENGTPTDYDEAAAAQIMNLKNIRVLLEYAGGASNGYATVWTCDLSPEYVAINGHYRS